MEKAYWENIRPYTKSKLNILRKYLYPLADIFFSLGIKKWPLYKEIYYVDCHAGKGMYCDCMGNKVLGSPLIALECAKEKQKQYFEKYGEVVRLRCIFVEIDKKSSKDLEKNCLCYKDDNIDYEIYKEEDINKVIFKILETIGSKPAFFFLDPGKTKHLKKETILAILNKKGAKDIMLNYIKGGPERISGIIRNNIDKIIDGTLDERNWKTIKTLTDFFGLGIAKHLDKNERERLKFFVESIFQNEATDKMEVLVYDMPYENKSDNIYYLLFASRKDSARKIMKDIFRKEKSVTYTGQARLDLGEKFEIE